MTATHSIVWDHSGCDDNQPDPDDNCCSPTGTLICHGDPTAPCHLGCDEWPCCESGWRICDDCEESIKEAAESRDPEDGPALIVAHPDELHDTLGHPFYSHDFCNFVESLPSDVVAECYDGARNEPPDYHDGPVDDVWDGDGYWWRYAEQP